MTQVALSRSPCSGAVLSAPPFRPLKWPPWKNTPVPCLWTPKTGHRQPPTCCCSATRPVRTENHLQYQRHPPITLRHPTAQMRSTATRMRHSTAPDAAFSHPRFPVCPVSFIIKVQFKAKIAQKVPQIIKNKRENASFLPPKSKTRPHKTPFLPSIKRRDFGSRQDAKAPR